MNLIVKCYPVFNIKSQQTRSWSYSEWLIREKHLDWAELWDIAKLRESSITTVMHWNLESCDILYVDAWLSFIESTYACEIMFNSVLFMLMHADFATGFLSKTIYWLIIIIHVGSRPVVNSGVVFIWCLHHKRVWLCHSWPSIPSWEKRWSGSSRSTSVTARAALKSRWAASRLI